jgi:hypothetical protein
LVAGPNCREAELKNFETRSFSRPVRAMLAGTAAGLVVMSAPPAAAAQDAPGRHVAGRVVVHARAGLDEARMAEVARGHGGRARRIGNSDLYVVDLPPGVSEIEVRQALSRHPLLKFAELDPVFTPALVPNDPYMGSAWHLTRISAPSAWDSSTGSGVTVAILDSGIESSHPDLSARIVPGWNFYNNNSDTSDLNGHGTVVAGAAAAAFNNGTGVASVAGNAKIMPLRIVDSTGAATGSMVAQALTYAADKGVRIANISYAGVPGNSTVQSAAQYMKSKGGLVIVSAGNTGSNLNLPAESVMIPVSATDSGDLITSWSSFGNHVALSAPGLDVWSTYKGAKYGTAWGTSLSSPLVAGVVALMMSARPDLPNTKIESLLFSSARDLGTAGRDVYYGYGRVDAAAAVAATLAAAAVDAQAPTVSISSPAGSASVSGVVAVDVAASDNVGVAKVELRVDGSVVATDLVAPFQLAWDSTKASNGLHTLTARAYDAAGNSAGSANVSVNVANAVIADTAAPSVAITSPANGSTVGTFVSIAASASDNSGCSGITTTLLIDGRAVTSGTGCTLSYKWNARKAAAGTHSISVTARDVAGNSRSSTIQVVK